MTRKLPKATTRTLPEISEADARSTRAAARERDAESGPPPSSGPRHPDRDSELHAVQAKAIVDRYTTFAAIGGIVPVPFVDTVGLMVIASRMTGALARHYGLPTKPERLRMIAAAAVAGVAPPVVTGTLVYGLARLIPGAPLFAAAISSTTAAGVTHALGQAFIRHFESGGTVADFDPQSYRRYLPAQP